MDRVLCGMRWSRCLVYLDDVISFGESISEALTHLEEVLCRLSDFGLQLKAKKCTFMQTEEAFLGHIVGTEALQSCLPHQLDIRTGQLWAEGRSTLQLHQQRLTPRAAAYLTTSVVLPPDSEVVAPLSVRSASGIWPGPCSMVEPCMDLTEDYESVRDLAGPSVCTFMRCSVRDCMAHQSRLMWTIIIVCVCQMTVTIWSRKTCFLWE